MKKTLLIVFAILFLTTVVFAETLLKSPAQYPVHHERGTRLDVPVWQDTFEEGNIGWTTSPTTASNLWHIAEAADAPSPSNAMFCQNAAGSYNTNMTNYLISPVITLPETGIIFVDFPMKGSFTDAGGSYPAIDYWKWEVTPDNGTHWYNMYNPYGDPTLPNYYMSECPSDWTSISDYFGWDFLISDYAGLNVKFRILFKSDSDLPSGTGIAIDNFTIYNTIFIAPPTSLAATVANPNVDLNWTAAVTGVTPEYLTSTNEDWRYLDAASEAFAMRVTNPNDTPTQLHGINFMLGRAHGVPIVGSPSLHVYTDNAGTPGDEIFTMDGITDIPNMEWKRVDITGGNIMIPASGSVFIGISNIDPGDDTDWQGIRADSSSTVHDTYVSNVGVWSTLFEYAQGHESNCALSGTIYNVDPNAPVLTNYKVYRSLEPTAGFELIGTVDPTMVTYTDTAALIGQISYYKVSAMYGDYESEFTNIVAANLIELLYTQFLYDDGESDTTYVIGVSNSVAVKFVTNPPIEDGVEIHYAKVYVTVVGSGQLILRIWDNDGVDGLPLTQKLQFSTPAANLTVGWNTIGFPVSNLVTDLDGIFYIGSLGFAGATQLGLDTDSTSSSFRRAGTAGAWAPIANGNLMIRALVSFVVGNDDQVATKPALSMKNYPNPFNPTTAINFSIPKAGHVSLNIYNIKGQLVRSLVNNSLAVGSHKIVWDGTNDLGNGVVSGVYFAKLDSAGKKLTQKMILLK